MNFLAPIPGMSLTREPGNAPYEQPPKFAEPEKALGFYFEKLEDEDRLDDLLFVLEQDFPVATLVDSLTSVGVMEGYHTVDVKMLISPILHEYIVSLAEAAGVKFREMPGPSKAEKMKTRDKERAKILIKKALEGSTQVSPENVQEATEALGQAEEPMAEEQSLISRRM